MKLSAILDDITALRVDAIVNAANCSLLGGGGVDGAIHRAAGPALAAACRSLGGCPTGEVRVTPGFHLPARWIIHAVGPIWQGGDMGETDLLASCYRKALLAANEGWCQSIAFPCISTGIYGFPADQACRIAVNTVRAYRPRSLNDITFCCFNPADLQRYQEALA